MTSHTKKRSVKTGLPPSPSALVHVGEKKAAASSVTLLDYDESDVRESVITAADLADKVRAARGTVWLNLHGLGDTTMLEQIGASFGLHPLVLEDILNTEQRSKMEDYGDYLYVVLKTFGYENNEGGRELIRTRSAWCWGKISCCRFLKQTAHSSIRCVSGCGQARGRSGSLVRIF